jgi:NhaA family Na+:H+ antiporter
MNALKRFLAQESAGGIVLTVCAIIAMTLANSPVASGYFGLLNTYVGGLSVLHWINDGLMTIFFFVVGMEIKREMVKGELSTAKKAALPFAAAIGGMVGPALIYLALNPTGIAHQGWGIPMATDIAFAVGILGLFGKRVPFPLKVFLLALAIVDDLGAVVIIALFYTKGIVGGALAAAAAGLALMFMLRKMGFKSYLLYVVIGAGVWFAVLKSGVHATVAGVLIGLLTPETFLRKRGDPERYSPIDDLVHWLHPYVSFGIMPIFALANAGVSVSGLDVPALMVNPVHQGVALGLLLGKPIGIFISCLIIVKIGMAQLPRSVDWPDIFGVGLLGGIGFTMALFISGLALPPDLEVFSKTGILIGSLMSAVAGSITLSFVLNRPRGT